MTTRLPLLSRLFRGTPPACCTERPAKFVPLLESLEGRALPSSLSPGLAHAARPIHHVAHVRHTPPIVVTKSVDRSTDKSPDSSLDKSSKDSSKDSSPDKALDKNGETSQDKTVEKSTDLSSDHSLDQSTDKPTDNSLNDSRP
jgi:hypothetical protein